KGSDTCQKKQHRDQPGADEMHEKVLVLDHVRPTSTGQSIPRLAVHRESIACEEITRSLPDGIPHPLRVQQGKLQRQSETIGKQPVPPPPTPRTGRAAMPSRKILQLPDEKTL